MKNFKRMLIGALILMTLGLFYSCTKETPNEDTTQAKPGELTQKDQVVKEETKKGDTDLIVLKDKSSASYCPSIKDGDVCTMNQNKAEEYCKSHNKRLPTVRELAQWAQTQGAKGRTESSYKDTSINDDKVKKEIKSKQSTNYRPVFKEVGKNSVIDFYYSNEGYRRPPGHLGDVWFWTSTVDPGRPNYAYAIDGNGGSIEFSNRKDVLNAVRCSFGW